MRQITIEEFHSELKAQGVPTRLDLAFKCPICKTAQSMRSLMLAAPELTEEKAESKIGFSCIGRLTDAGPYKRGEAAGRGCNWTLGGLFQLHELEVIKEDGTAAPYFEIATPAEAQALLKLTALARPL